MPSLRPVAVGPLRLLVDGPADYKPQLAPTVSPRFFEEDVPYREVVSHRITGALEPGPELSLEPVEKVEAKISGDADVVRIEYPGSVSRCDLARRAITIDVVPGARAIIPGRFLVSLLLPGAQCMAVHASGIFKDGKGYVLAGQSEAGKTTVSRIAHEAGLKVLNDDTVVVGWNDDGEPVVWGTLFHGDAKLAHHGPAPLAGLYFLNQATEDGREPLNLVQATKQLYLNTFPVASTLPSAAAKVLVGQMLDLSQRVCEKVPAYRLDFRPTPDVLEQLR